MIFFTRAKRIDAMTIDAWNNDTVELLLLYYYYAPTMAILNIHVKACHRDTTYYSLLATYFLGPPFVLESARAKINGANMKEVMCFSWSGRK